MKRQRSLLLSSTALTFVTALGVGLQPSQVLASCTAISSNTTISDGSVSCVTWTGGTISITSGGTIVSTTAVNVSVASATTVGNLVNSGTIQNNAGGSFDTMSIQGTVGSILNNGLISGQTVITNSAGSIGLINNVGSITGSIAIDNAGGKIGTIVNASGATISGTSYAIQNIGGTIGGGATAINDGGTLIGAINNEGTIVGNILSNQSLTIAGTPGHLSGGSITTSGHDLLFASGSNQVLADNLNVGSSNTVSVAGIVQVSGLTSITGNYTESSNGILDVSVTNSTTYGKLSITGNALLSNDQISIGGALSNGETFTIMQAASAASNYNDILVNAVGYYTSISSVVGAGVSSLVVNLATCANQTISGGSTISSGVCGITWDSGNLSIASGVIIHGSTIALNNNNSAVGTLTNNGVLYGTYAGIANSGSIASIFNGATINSGTSGIANTGSIGLITNAGLINSQYGDGIYNSSIATIGNIINLGTITASTEGIANKGVVQIISNSGTVVGISGIYNTGSIATILNSGTIQASQYSGVYNSGSISVIANSITGTIQGGRTAAILNTHILNTISNTGLVTDTAAAGIDNSGTIGQVLNDVGGTIIGDVNGAIYNNAGTITALTNNASATILGSVTGIKNTGTIGSIVNNGLIEGPAALISTGTILSAVTNAGTIEGNISVAQAITFTGGSSSALGTLAGYNGATDTIATNNHNLTFDANAFQLLDDNVNVGASNTLINDGYLRANAAHSVTGNYSQGSGGMLVIGVTDANNYGRLIVSGSATMTNGQVLITPTAGHLSDGETFTIVQANASGTDYSGVSGSANGFSVSTSSIASGGNEDLIVSLAGTGGTAGGANTYAAVGQQGGGANGSSVGGALDQISAQVSQGNNADFASILTTLNNIGLAQGPAAEGAAIQQLAPGQLSAGIAANNMTASQTALVIGQHQQNIRSRSSSVTPTGRAAGSEMMSGALWMQIDGGYATSTLSGAGYHQSYYGMTFGVDDHVNKNATIGLALGWSRNIAKGDNAISGSDIATDTPELTAYGTYRMGRAYVDGMMGVGYNMFRQSRAIDFLNSIATSNYNGMQYMGNVESGYDFNVTPRTILTPLAGFSATITDTDSYTEVGAGPADTTVGRQIINSYSTSLGGRMVTTVPTSWGAFLPEVKLAWAHDLNHSPISSNATMAGVDFSTTTPRAAQDGAELSLAATLQRTDTLSIRAEYDGDLRSDYQSHTGILKGSVKF